MDLVLTQHPGKLFKLQRDVAKYFFNFNPSLDSLYIRIIKRLDIKDISFASLNYDTLLEQAIHRSGFFTKDNLDTKNENEVNLCLPHGCSNLFLEGFNIPPGLFKTTCVENVLDSTKAKRVKTLKEFQSELKSRAFPPIMACFNSKKTVPVGKGSIEKQKMMFKKMVRDADLIVIIGVRVRMHDDHIWTPYGLFFRI
jgi:hypothetical protein